MNSISTGWIHRALETIFSPRAQELLRHYESECGISDPGTESVGATMGLGSAPVAAALSSSSSSSALSATGAADLTTVAHTIHPSAPRVQVVWSKPLRDCVLLQISDTRHKLLAIVVVRDFNGTHAVQRHCGIEAPSSALFDWRCSHFSQWLHFRCLIMFSSACACDRVLRLRSFPPQGRKTCRVSLVGLSSCVNIILRARSC